MWRGGLSLTLLKRARSNIFAINLADDWSEFVCLASYHFGICDRQAQKSCGHVMDRCGHHLHPQSSRISVTRTKDWVPAPRIALTTAHLVLGRFAKACRFHVGRYAVSSPTFQKLHCPSYSCPRGRAMQMGGLKLCAVGGNKRKGARFGIAW